MFWKYFKLAAFSVLGLALIPDSRAEQSAPESLTRQYSEEQQSVTGSQEALPAQDQAAEGEQGVDRDLNGKVVDEKEVSILGGSVKNKVVMLELQDGQRIAVDLGPVDALKDRIRVGDSAKINGRLIIVGEDPVFLASRVNVSGQDFQVDRQLTETTSQQSSFQGHHQGSEQAWREYNFNGVIENEQNVDLREGNAQNKVVLLRTDEGKSVLVDLGPADKLGGVPLSQGAKISVKGHGGWCDEASVLFADQVEAGGRSFTIRRPDFE